MPKVINPLTKNKLDIKSKQKKNEIKAFVQSINYRDCFSSKRGAKMCMNTLIKKYPFVGLPLSATKNKISLMAETELPDIIGLFKTKTKNVIYALTKNGTYIRLTENIPSTLLKFIKEVPDTFKFTNVQKQNAKLDFSKILLGLGSLAFVFMVNKKMNDLIPVSKDYFQNNKKDIIFINNDELVEEFTKDYLKLKKLDSVLQFEEKVKNLPYNYIYDTIERDVKIVSGTDEYNITDINIQKLNEKFNLPPDNEVLALVVDNNLIYGYVNSKGRILPMLNLDYNAIELFSQSESVPILKFENSRDKFDIISELALKFDISYNVKQILKHRCYNNINYIFDAGINECVAVDNKDNIIPMSNLNWNVILELNKIPEFKENIVQIVGLNVEDGYVNSVLLTNGDIIPITDKIPTSNISNLLLIKDDKEFRKETNKTFADKLITDINELENSVLFENESLFLDTDNEETEDNENNRNINELEKTNVIETDEMMDINTDSEETNYIIKEIPESSELMDIDTEYEEQPIDNSIEDTQMMDIQYQDNITDKVKELIDLFVEEPKEEEVILIPSSESEEDTEDKKDKEEIILVSDSEGTEDDEDTEDTSSSETSKLELFESDTESIDNEDDNIFSDVIDSDNDEFEEMDTEEENYEVIDKIDEIEGDVEMDTEENTVQDVSNVLDLDKLLDILPNEKRLQFDESSIKKYNKNKEEEMLDVFIAKHKGSCPVSHEYIEPYCVKIQPQDYKDIKSKVITR